MNHGPRVLIFLVTLCIIVFLAQLRVPISQPSVAVPIAPIDEVIKNTTLPLYKRFMVLSPVSLYMQTHFSDGAKNPCPKPKQLYSDMFFAFVDFTHALPDGYVPNDLVPLPSRFVKKTSGTVCMRAEAADAMIAMLTDAANSQQSIVVSSAFRSSETQETILNERLNTIGEAAYTHVALPGHSEHQLGTTADLAALSLNYSSAAHAFGDSIEGKWIAAHAVEYGFVQSYPYGKEPITGYIYEPWHYRYVGLQTANAVVNASLTLTEYLNPELLLGQQN